jgi:LmbE family N-acetylglucosaminyl deacetylase
MMRLTLGGLRTPPRRVLCLGSHSDDIEIGCGGTMLTLLNRFPNLEFSWIVFSSGHERAEEARKSAALFLKGAKRSRIVVKDFRDRFFPFIGAEIKEFFDQLGREFSPDLIFTHYRHDLHQDHRTICELTWNAFRNHLILEYEIPKYDGDLGAPNVFVPLDRGVCERKIKHITAAFQSQRTKPWFTRETFLALLRLRGIECGATSGLAEAFHGRKIVV